MRRYHLTFLRFVVCVALLMIMISLLVCSIAYWTMKSVSGRLMAEKDTHLYKYLEIDSISNTSSTGIVSLFEELESGEFISYRSHESYNHDFYTLISNFGASQYKCNGKCYCRTPVLEKRRAALLAQTSKAILYLVVATTSVLALNIAKKHFEEECQLFSDAMDDGNRCEVISEVISCDKVVQMPILTDKEIEETELISHEDYGGEKYFCKGNCVSFPKIKQLDQHKASIDPDLVDIMRITSIKRSEHDFDCKELQISSEVYIGYTDWKNVEEEVPANQLEKVKWKFLTDHLQDFCENNSLVLDKDTLHLAEEDWWRIPMCVGFDILARARLEDREVFSSVPISDINRSIVCVREVQSSL